MTTITIPFGTVEVFRGPTGKTLIEARVSRIEVLIGEINADTCYAIAKALIAEADRQRREAQDDQRLREALIADDSP